MRLYTASPMPRSSAAGVQRAAARWSSALAAKSLSPAKGRRPCPRRKSPSCRDQSRRRSTARPPAPAQGASARIRLRAARCPRTRISLRVARNDGISCPVREARLRALFRVTALSCLRLPSTLISSSGVTCRAQQHRLVLAKRYHRGPPTPISQSRCPLRRLFFRRDPPAHGAAAGLGRPDTLAEGADGTPAARISASATGCEGMRRPTVSSPADTMSGTAGDLGAPP